MGDFIATLGKPYSAIDITPDRKTIWGDFNNFGKSMHLGFFKENIFAMAIADSTVKQRVQFQDVEAYNVFNDPQLADVYDDMGYFMHSGSPQETSWLLARKKAEDEYATNSPGYITGRILGGLTDPTALLMFSKVGKFFFTGSRLARSSKVGMALGGEEIIKRKLDRARTLTDSILITGGGFVLPAIFPGIARTSPEAKKIFKLFDKRADRIDLLDDAVNKAAQDVSPMATKTIKPESPFLEGSIGAAKIRTTFSEDEWLEMEKIAKTGLGWFGEKGMWTPIFRTLKSSSLTAKEAIGKLLENPLYQVKNFKNVASEQSIERNIARRKVQVFKAETEIEDLYKVYLQRMGKRVPKTRVGLYLQKDSEGIISFSQFKRAIFLNRIGSPSDLAKIDEVAKAAAVSEKYIYSLGKEYDELGIPLMYIERQISITKFKLAGMEKELKKMSKIKGWKSKDSIQEIKNLKIVLKKLQEKLNYMKVNGSLAKNYVNRVWLRDQVESRWEEFRNIVIPMIKARNPKLTIEAIEEILESVKSAQPYVRFDSKSSNPLAISRHFRTRELRLSKADEEKLAELGFIETDLFVLQRLYFNSVAPDIELTKVFGDPMMSGFKWSPSSGYTQGINQIVEEYNKRITKTRSKSKKKKLEKERDEVVQDLKAGRDLLRGTYGLPDNPQRAFSRGVRMMKLYNSMTMLTGALAAVPDVARILMTSGINRGFRTSWDMFTNVLSTEVLKLSRNQAYLSGEALDMVLGSRAMSMYDLENAFGVFNKLEKGVSRTGNMYFTYINLMNPWNTMMKSWASAVNGTRMLEEIENWVIKGKISKNNKAKLLNSGIDEVAARKIWDQYVKHGLGTGANKADWKQVRIANTEMWDDEARATADLFHNALGRDINITIVTPGKGEVPLWFNTEMGGVIVQFKKFAAAATQRMLMRGMQEKDAAFFGGALMLLAAGAMVDATRQKAFNRSYAKKPFGQKIVDAFDRSGLGGIFSDMNNILERLTDNKIGLRPTLGAARPYSSYTQKNIMSGFGLFGPTSSQIGNISDLMWDWGRGKHTHYSAKNVRRLIPFQNVWYLDSLFDQVEKGLR